MLAGVLGVKLDRLVVQPGRARMSLGLVAVELLLLRICGGIGSALGRALALAGSGLAVTGALFPRPGAGGLIGIVHTLIVPFIHARNLRVNP